MKFLSLIATLSLCLNSVSEEIVKEAYVFKSPEIGQKSPEGVMQYRIPDLHVRKNGEIIATTVGRMSRPGDHSKSTAFFAVSKDGGKRWRHINTDSNYENPENRPTDAFPISKITNEAQVIYNEKKGKYIALYMDHYAVYMTDSKDLVSWSKPILLDLKKNDAEKCWQSPSSFYIDKQGEIGFCLVLKYKVDGESVNSARLVWTRDFKTFEQSPNLPVNGNETNFCRYSRNDYFVTTRISPRRINLRYNRAKKKFEVLGEMENAYWRCAAGLAFRKGVLYMSTPTKSRTTGRLLKSVDNGKTWTVACVLTEGSTHFGYSSISVLKDGSLGILSERDRVKGEDGKHANLKFTRIKL